jgi:hypothetical protein
MIEYARDYYEYFLLAHVIATALGLGAATITDVLFFKFLKDFKLTREEGQTLNTMSQIIWAVLIIAVISGLALYLPQMSRLNQSPPFLAKMISFAVIIINGIGLNLLIAPKLEQIFSGSPTTIPRYWRRLSFAGGAVSITSWYSTFILGSFQTLPYDLPNLLLGYGGFVLFAIIVSQIMEASFGKKSQGNNPQQQ